jgi:hypothetical protein
VVRDAVVERLADHPRIVLRELQGKQRAARHRAHRQVAKPSEQPVAREQKRPRKAHSDDGSAGARDQDAKLGVGEQFGDATRLDHLHAAGAGDAKVLVVAIDDVDASLELIDEARHEFPHITIYARARNVQHVYAIMGRPVAGFERETFESSLRLGSKVLEGLGWSVHSARRAANRFREHNLEILRDLRAIRSDQTALVARARQVREDLTSMFEREKEVRDKAPGGLRRCTSANELAMLDR